MVQSPIKFDDLAFILLFFFMIIAVVTFSSSMNVNTANDSEPETAQSVTVYLDENGTLSQSVFSQGSAVDLVCAPSVSWSVIQNAVQSIVSQNVEVTLVI